MRISSHLAVGSPTARVAAIVVATMLIALSVVAAGIAGSRLLAADGSLVVDPSDSKAYQTIGAAVAAAPDGAIIRVRPGRYRESIQIVGKDVTILGDGTRDEIILEAALNDDPAGDARVGFDYDGLPYYWALYLEGSDAHIENITILGNAPGGMIEIVGRGADPSFDGVTLRQLGPAAVTSTIQWGPGTSGALIGSVVEGYINIMGSPAIIENEMTRACFDTGLDEADDSVSVHPIIHDNSIHGCPNEYSIYVANGAATITDNDIYNEEAAHTEDDAESEGRIAIILESDVEQVEISGNTIHDSLIGIRVSSGVAGSIDSNTFVNNLLAISSASDDLELLRNTITGGSTGIAIVDGSPLVSENSVAGATLRGISISGTGANPILVGNVLCDNASNLVVSADAAPQIEESNEICEDAPTG